MLLSRRTTAMLFEAARREGITAPFAIRWASTLQSSRIRMVRFPGRSSLSCSPSSPSSAEDGHIVLEVADTGVGISKQNIGRVFEPFFSTKPAGKGTGLGLAITQRLVVGLGGDIGVISTPLGSTFRVALLAAERRSDDAGPVRTDSAPARVEHP